MTSEGGLEWVRATIRAASSVTTAGNQHDQPVMNFLQRVAMRMGYMASWTDESLFQRPPSEDRGCPRTRNAQGPVRSHLRGRDLHRQALRRQGQKRRISGAGQGSGQTTQDRRAS